MYRYRIDKRDTPLIRAAKANDLSALAVALERTDNPDIKDRNVNTALIHLAQHGNVAGIELMCAAGANLDHVNKTGDSALHIALIAHQTDAAYALVKAGADPNLANGSGLTGLQMMARAGDREGVQLALKHGGDPLKKNPRTGNNAVAYARAHNHPEIVDLLKRKSDPMNNVGSLASLLVLTKKLEPQRIRSVYGDRTPDPLVRPVSEWQQKQQAAASSLKAAFGKS